MSFNIALSGIQAINEQLNSISNNIANAGTYGYKAQRANFSSMYAGSQPTGTQIGSTTQNISLTGGVLNTGRAMDASIDGRGFFISKTSTGQEVYSRVGIFTKDGNDFLVDSAGRRVQGAKLTPGVAAPGPKGDIVVPTTTLPAKASTEIDFAANLSADWKKPAGTFPAAPTAATPPDPSTYNMSKTTLAYDSQGKAHTVTQYFSRTSDTSLTVDVHTLVDGAPAATGQSSQLTFDNAGKLTAGATNSVTFNAAPAANVALTVVYTGTTFQAGEATTSTNVANGYTTGQYVGVELGTDGKVIAKYSNGEQQAVGQILIATMSNEDALTPVNDTSWVANADVGTITESNPGESVAGGLAIATLEGSNVDITSELVGLMGSQRNYQANSKVITTENAMLQSLMQAL
ncbi:flagellar hook protein FlgE [Pseudoduganella plicata]|uniref:Flagellar hook protein FlgE n=1 Tax=Pseudoduganella plicata TaxID=321984 RepID=A0A4V1ATH7_9BURK|nr:flagellar hook-basal body complex protein [Pseudoduganella plicata]QBQ35708.1 flagellar hook-basal body complex protein [Pseudoduganella plicata]GGY95808.1 flagellar hook protein FlgE [Pseudoduganella plicata]